jgi:hypothetical protein
LYKTVVHASEEQEEEDMAEDQDWVSPEEMLKTLGTSAEEVETSRRTGEANASRGKTDKRICACGHRVAAHTEIAGVTFCKPSRMECPCKKCRPVLEAEDTRVFIRATTGGGKLHALSQGLYNLIQRGKNARWIIELKCDRCGEESEKPLSPVPVTQSGVAVSYATGYDALLCDECRTVV